MKSVGHGNGSVLNDEDLFSGSQSEEIPLSFHNRSENILAKIQV
jgi:hypothetical protein